MVSPQRCPRKRRCGAMYAGRRYVETTGGFKSGVKRKKLEINVENQQHMAERVGFEPTVQLPVTTGRFEPHFLSAKPKKKYRFMGSNLPPEGKHWIYEIKHDGYRCQVLVE